MLIPNIFVILYNVRSAYNVGSIFRTADAAGVSKIYLAGFTPLPTDQFGRTNKEIAKTALGAEKNILWEHADRINPLLKKLRNDGVYCIAVEQSSKSVDYKKISLDKPTAFIFGNEVRGLSQNVLNKSDIVAEIPMHGKKESLNVAVAVGVMLFGVLDR